jgi:hypothetical protein
MILTLFPPSPIRQVLCSVRVDSDTHTFKLWLGLERRYHSRPSAFGELVFLCIDPQHR